MNPTVTASQRPIREPVGLCLILNRKLDRRVRDLGVATNGHGLILTGRSYTWFGKQLAQHTAMELAGLPVIVNAIEVVPPDSVDDSDNILLAEESMAGASVHVS